MKLATGARGRLEHPAFLYSGPDDFLRRMVPYVQERLERGDSVLVAARGDVLPVLEAEISDPEGAAYFEDAYEWNPHPAARLRAVMDFIYDESERGAARFCVAGEPPLVGTRPELVREWQRYEAAVNYVFQSAPASLLCLYDTSRLDSGIVDVAHHTHPTVRRGDEEQTSVSYQKPSSFLAAWNHTLYPTPAEATRLGDVRDVARTRRFLMEHALAAGVEQDKAVELGVAATEILTNGLVHADGARLALWVDADRFVCEIENLGESLSDPFAGFHPPDEEAEGGRGLWLARQLVELLQIVPTETGTTFRLHVPTGAG